MKLLKVLVAAAVMVAMVTPAIAEDRLSLNGQMRVGGWYLDDGSDAVGTGRGTGCVDRLESHE